ncbi:protein AATF-like [Pyrus ussuriensis x Pyrus communis]|uniref:Protein AATF-like n=1 Tax=Pyrus ussuriensis x Pyrus communis TaxID=2448454 RepID=A0A5N5HHX7_9ROSA|nr:protein AATF-like [Pyrus ussuriensis x Pyrus communis]
MEQEEDDFDDEHDGEEEEEESENEEEDGREEGEEENGDEKNDNKDAKMEELVKEYMNLRNQEQDILKNLKRHKDEDLLKGQAMKNQKALWDKALEFRFLHQKAFSNSNRLPQEPVRSLFCDSHQGVSTAYSDLALLEKNPSIVQATDSKSGQSKRSESSKNIDGDGDEDWSQISQLLSRIATFRDKSINNWQRKTEVTTGAAAIKSKLHAFNQNISEQVASYMRDPSRVVRQMQMRKSAVSVFGAKNTAKGEETQSEAGAQADAVTERIFETIDPASSETAFYSLNKLHTKKRKIVDRRASKSRKIRYNVHEKMVNFMAPETMAVPPMLPDLNNLFGLKKQKAASVV